MKSNHNLQPARVSCDALKALCAERGYRIDINWRWDGRSRGGVLTIVGPEAILAQARYSRSTQMWGRSDETLDRVHTGSPKHMAVLEALKRL